MSRIKFFCLITSALMLALGCGEATDKFKANRPATVKASGVVNYKGTPLAQAMIVLEPTTPDGTAASALTDEQGQFSLQAFPPDEGAVAGSYKVTITKTETASNVMVTESSHDEPQARPKAAKSLIPGKYARSGTSGLTAEIPSSGTDSLKFDLQD